MKSGSADSLMYSISPNSPVSPDGTIELVHLNSISNLSLARSNSNHTNHIISDSVGALDIEANRVIMKSPVSLARRKHDLSKWHSSVFTLNSLPEDLYAVDEEDINNPNNESNLSALKSFTSLYSNESMYSVSFDSTPNRMAEELGFSRDDEGSSGNNSSECKEINCP